jgi:hypothetical protein
MAYNEHQYDAAKDFVLGGDENVASSAYDQLRVQTYDLYENLYRNATVALKIVLRGDDQSAIIMPNGRKIVEATNRFLGVNVDYLVEAAGDEGARQEVEAWWTDFWKREAFPSKFNSNKRWGLIRGDAYFYVYADPNKVQSQRISIKELDPRQVFEIEDAIGNTIGVHIVDKVQDYREPDKPEKQIARRRTFRITEEGISSELNFWTIGKWDDRTVKAVEVQERIAYPEYEEEVFLLPSVITQLPVYKWRNQPPQNSNWGTSQLAGLETLLYALNQSLSDEDSTLVFQGLGMYVTDAAPPLDPNTGDVADWNIGPKQIIEIATGQRFDRVTGVSDLSPFINHMQYINDGMAEASGTPQIAIGRVDVAVAESGISLQLQLMPLLAQNAEKELELVNILDQMFFDITTMWLPGYEPEQFGNVEVMSQLSVVSIFDDPMPVDRQKKIEEIITLDQSNLILKSMSVTALRSLGWQYPSVDPYTGQPLSDDDIALLLLQQVKQSSAAMDPYAGTSDMSMGGVDEFGNPIEPDQLPDQQTVDLGVTG